MFSDHVARQAVEAERKLQNSHYDGEEKMWDWDKYIALHEEQHTIMESLTDYGYSGMDNGTFFKASKALSWRLQSMLSGPNQKVWNGF